MFSFFNCCRPKVDSPIPQESTPAKSVKSAEPVESIESVESVESVEFEEKFYSDTSSLDFPTLYSVVKDIIIPETDEPKNVLGKEDQAMQLNFAKGRLVIGSNKGIGYGPINQDRVAYNAETSLILVADGLGGNPESEYVAELLATAVAEGGSTFSTMINTVKDQLEKEDHPGATCFSSAQIFSKNGQDKVRIRLSGDCKVIIYNKDGIIRYQSDDGVKMFSAIKKNTFPEKIGEEEYTHYHDNRHIVNMWIDKESCEFKRVKSISLLAGDFIVLGSDGTLDNISGSEIGNIIRHILEHEKNEDDVPARIYCALEEATRIRMTSICSTSDASDFDLKFTDKELGTQFGIGNDHFLQEPKKDNRSVAIYRHNPATDSLPKDESKDEWGSSSSTTISESYSHSSEI